MQKLMAAAAALAVIALSGCASVLDGTSQMMTFNTTPPGAACVLSRKDAVIGQVNPTPGGVLIKKTKDNIKVACTKDGYQETTALIKSEIQGSTWGNIVLGGGIGWAIDSASGADNHYQDIINVTLIPTQVAADSAKERPTACDEVKLETAMLLLLDKAKSDKSNEKRGRQQMIFGRYASDGKQVRDGYRMGNYENARDLTAGDGCSEQDYLGAASKALPEGAKGKYPEAMKAPGEV